MRETSANEPLMTHRKHLDVSIETREPHHAWEEHSGYLLTGYAVSGVKARGSHSGSPMELENLVGDAKGKGSSGGPVRPKVPMRQPGADCSVLCAEQRIVQTRARADAACARADLGGGESGGSVCVPA